MGELTKDANLPSTGSSYEEGDDLCERMDQLSTSDGNQGRVECSEEQVKSSPRRWQVGDICVCRFCEDNKWYFAEISYIDRETDCCDIRFLYYADMQYFVRLDRLHRVDASTWKWVEDQNNAFAAQGLLQSGNMESQGVRISMVLPQQDAQSEGGVMNGEDRGKSSKWRTGGGPTGSQTLPALSPFWRTLLLELYGSDESAIKMLLNSYFVCGFQNGHAKANENTEGGCN